MALKYLMHENVGIPCTHYFDDYTIIVPEVLGNPADELTGQFLTELGWGVRTYRRGRRLRRVRRYYGVS